MKIVLFILLLNNLLFSIERSEKLFECTRIFESRKNELLVELERIDEQRQSLESLKIATDELLNKKEVRLDAREKGVAQKLEATKKAQADTKSMLEKNEKILEAIKNQKMDKVSQVYAKMKAASAANILAKMEIKEAGAILNKLKPKTVGKIFSKMDAQKASELSQYIIK